MKFYTILFLTLFITASSYAQQSKIDSLKNALNTATHDSIRLRSITDIYQYYEGFNYDSVLFYADKGFSLARKSKQSLHEGRFLVVKANTLVQKGEYAEALKNLLQAFEILQNPDSEKYAFGLGKLTSAEFRLARLDFAYQTYGQLMEETGNTEQAIFHYKESIRIASLIKDYFRIASVSSLIARQYLDASQLDSVEVYAQKSVKLFEQINSGGKTFPILYLARKNFKAKNDELGREYLYKALQVATEYKATTRQMLLWIYSDLSSVHQNNGVKDSSLYYAKKAYEVGSEPGLINSKWFREGGVYEDLYKAYLLNNQPDSVLKYQGLTLTTIDAWNKEKYKNLATFQSALLSEATRLRELEKQQIETQSKIRTYSFLAVLAVLSIIGFILYRNIRQKRKANLVLQEQKDKVESTLHELKSTQAQLIQSEKMASLGELTAGIAHEIQNPLNFVNNFSEVSSELLDEMNEELDKGDIEEAKFISKDIKQNLEKINHHGKRADAIVKGMLEHSRSGSGARELTDVNTLANEYLNLTYQSFKSKNKEVHIELTTDLDPSLPKIELVRPDIGKVLLNILNNAFYACAHSEFFPDSYRDHNSELRPLVKVSTKNLGDKIQISISDNGPGIPDSIKDKIFQPFFTTKPTGQGTGLGLSLSYDIVKAHGGELKVETKEGEGSAFIITLFNHTV
ncbi:tetratricopeptide repeat-containing sensor histidine kinase [Cognataquiflexum rubidum]|uniref:tetratricopeptide repeat-containing sensor histidine kinase n=1 Tax=Cognataquiflexum rubidum TaxID=2922273 RepID=UPI001F13992F|nr:tetratricopeptide repeat-containing sensor histidine kinase [Cognataquiflexum rubidum]MCH6235774.1 tetratricopeptide repeat-containing sensor histidine kinase [Cognataquiflexum rubidum]